MVGLDYSRVSTLQTQKPRTGSSKTALIADLVFDTPDLREPNCQHLISNTWISGASLPTIACQQT